MIVGRQDSARHVENGRPHNCALLNRKNQLKPKFLPGNREFPRLLVVVAEFHVPQLLHRLDYEEVNNLSSDMSKITFQLKAVQNLPWIREYHGFQIENNSRQLLACEIICVQELQSAESHQQSPNFIHRDIREDWSLWYRFSRRHERHFYRHAPIVFVQPKLNS